MLPGCQSMSCFYRYVEITLERLPLVEPLPAPLPFRQEIKISPFVQRLHLVVKVRIVFCSIVGARVGHGIDMQLFSLESRNQRRHILSPVLGFSAAQSTSMWRTNGESKDSFALKAAWRGPLASHTPHRRLSCFLTPIIVLNTRIHPLAHLTFCSEHLSFSNVIK